MSSTRLIRQKSTKVLPFFLGGKPTTGSSTLKVLDKFTGEVGFEVSVAGPDAIEQALQQATYAAPAMKALPHYKRKDILLQTANELVKREEEIVYTLCVEAGKPVKDAKTEVLRAIDTFTIAAEESIRQYGEYLPLDVSSRNAGFEGVVKRFPTGLISMISPFNFPVNLVAHKVAPAIAAGCPFVLKPSDFTPVGALIIGECLAKTELPEGAFSIFPCELEHAKRLSTDSRIKVLSFTGSEAVGWGLHKAASKMKVVLELGGNAACVADETADVNHVANRITFGAFYYSGQSCISVQRVYAHESIYDALKAKLVENVKGFKYGDPMKEDTFIGPMINENAAKRLHRWVHEAEQLGGKVLAGGHRNGNFFDATILEDVPASATICNEEAFGPICVLHKFSDFKNVIGEVNNSRFGLQAGIFTRDLHRAYYAYEHLEVGGVVINDIPSVRVDAQPYGGIKNSGLGREGVRATIEEFTEPKIMLLKDVGKL